MTIVKMFKDYKPFMFFMLGFLLFFVLGLLVGLPVVIEFVRTGMIDKMPSAVLASSLMVLAVLSFVTGMILDTVVSNAKKEYELNLYRVYSEKLD